MTHADMIADADTACVRIWYDIETEYPEMRPQENDGAWKFLAGFLYALVVGIPAALLFGWLG